LKDADKAVYEKKAKEKKDAYDAFVKSEEGAALLKSYKDDVTSAKNEVKPPPPAPEPKKRKAPEPEGDDKPSPKAAKETAAKVASPPKKGRGRGAKPKEAEPEAPSALDASILAEAEKLGFKSAIQNLASRVADKGFTGKQMLEALRDGNGLVNKAKNALLAGA